MSLKSLAVVKQLIKINEINIFILGEYKMKNKKLAVFGIYPSRVLAEKAVEKLKNDGFRNSDVSVLFASTSATESFAHENSTKAPEGAAAGSLSGATIGGTLGWLVGIGSLAIPGVGPFIAAGPIVATLAGVGAGAAVGGLTGALIGLGIPEYEAKRYEGHINEGGVLLSVRADDSAWADKAEEVLEQTGAESISRKSEDSADKSRSAEKYQSVAR